MSLNKRKIFYFNYGCLSKTTQWHQFMHDFNEIVHQHKNKQTCRLCGPLKSQWALGSKLFYVSSMKTHELCPHAAVYTQAACQRRRVKFSGRKEAQTAAVWIWGKKQPGQNTNVRPNNPGPLPGRQMCMCNRRTVSPFCKPNVKWSWFCMKLCIMLWSLVSYNRWCKPEAEKINKLVKLQPLDEDGNKIYRRI